MVGLMGPVWLLLMMSLRSSFGFGYHGGQNDYRLAFLISTSNFGKNNRDPAKDPRIPGNGHNDFPV